MTDWIYVADDDLANLKMAGHILSRSGMRVTAFRSGRALLDALVQGVPDLILLDVRMPAPDGFETLTLLRRSERGREVPVIFLTADEDPETESRGLRLGAMDFIKKPFVPDVLALRVKHTIELVRLQRGLAAEVSRKTAAIERLSLHIVETLAEAIDAKDTYTHGHSKRVAAYASELGRRYGYTEEQCRELYMMGLLHDVGKIGIPDGIINKPGRLTDEEFETVKTHPPKGARILAGVGEMPGLATGARWHHERYDGTGYPDGLAGEAIPEAARIIAVADAYDAMTSCRSYRGVMPQARVRGEIERGRGTQFDPVFADLLLDMIAEDADYKLCEQAWEEKQHEASADP